MTLRMTRGTDAFSTLQMETDIERWVDWEKVGGLTLVVFEVVDASFATLFRLSKRRC